MKEYNHLNSIIYLNQIFGRLEYLFRILLFCNRLSFSWDRNEEVIMQVWLIIISYQKKWFWLWRCYLVEHLLNYSDIMSSNLAVNSGLSESTFHVVVHIILKDKQSYNVICKQNEHIQIECEMTWLPNLYRVSQNDCNT